MPQAAAQGHHSDRDAETHKVSTAAGEYCKEHRCVSVCSLQHGTINEQNKMEMCYFDN